MSGHVRLVLPHQLFEAHLDAPGGTTFVLVEHDLLFRQYRFHTHKLVLHRASMRRFASRLRERGFDVVALETDGRTTSRAALARAIRSLAPTRVTAYDVVDDWLSQDLTAALADGGYELTSDDVLDTPNFLTTRAQLAEYAAPAGGRTRRMQHFYSWQRKRLGVMVTEDGLPEGGRWSFDEDNRKKLPRGHPVPDPSWPPSVVERSRDHGDSSVVERSRDHGDSSVVERSRDHADVQEAITWVRRAFPDNPGDPSTFPWATSHAEAEAAYVRFLDERLHQFGPYEDALSAQHPLVFHSALTPALNVGLISPERVLRGVLEADDVPIASREGFVRQVIGWREYMRATYVWSGRTMRTSNHLAHTRPLADGWWTASTGLAPVDLVIERVLERGWAHHIERLMVLGNAMTLLRTDPDAAYEWFMEMFVDAYDWVMVPNVYAMSQFAAGESITTKPYVSGSNYLRTMSDYPAGEWREDWDALYWTFVRDHHDVFAGNARSQVIARAYDNLSPATKAAHTKRAGRWL